MAGRIQMLTRRVDRLIYSPRCITEANPAVGFGMKNLYYHPYSHRSFFMHAGLIPAASMRMKFESAFAKYHDQCRAMAFEPDLFVEDVASGLISLERSVMGDCAIFRAWEVRAASGK